jgi:hypothetical protein
MAARCQLDGGGGSVTGGRRKAIGAVGPEGYCEYNRE